MLGINAVERSGAFVSGNLTQHYVMVCDRHFGEPSAATRTFRPRQLERREGSLSALCKRCRRVAALTSNRQGVMEKKPTPPAVQDPGPFYHGTKADLRSGDLLRPVRLQLRCGKEGELLLPDRYVGCGHVGSGTSDR
jgi:hypothetical protein